MTIVYPWHSSKTMDVHHNNTACTLGNNIERKYIRPGTGGLPMCKVCQKLMSK